MALSFLVSMDAFARPLDTPSGGVPPTAAARQPHTVLFQQGVRLFRAGAFAAARLAFERAYELEQDPRLLADSAACLAAEGQSAAAVRLYRRFLADAGPSVPAPVRRRTERAIADLRRRVGDVTLVGLPDEAMVSLDGKDLGPVQGPVAVDRGRHLFEVLVPGGEVMAHPVEVVAGHEVRLVFLPLAGHRQPGDAVLEFSPHRRPPPLGRGPLLWIGIGLTGALGTGAVVTGVLASSAHNDLADPRLDSSDRDELRLRSRSLSGIADGLMGGAAVTGLATLALFVFAGGVQGPEEHIEAHAPVRPRLVRGGAVCDLTLDF